MRNGHPQAAPDEEGGRGEVDKEVFTVYGNMGKVVEVDLSTGQVEEIDLDEEVYRKYIGGAGLAAWLLVERGDLNAEPLDPEALLIFACGPMAGTGFSGTSRLSACARSPLTAIWGQSSCGGDFAPELKRCGYDALLIRGRAEKPSYLLLEDDSVEIMSAADLWGKDTYEATDELKRRHGKGFRTLVIGPASENGVLYGCICNDYGHFFGRAGMGTVMGSKNLKAVVARGGKKVTFKDPEKVRELGKILRKQMEESVFCNVLGTFGTAANLEAKMYEGDVPCRNWSVGLWEEGAQTLSGITMADTILVDRDTCRGCLVKCKRIVEVTEEPYSFPKGPGPEYETIATFGSLILNPNLSAVAKANWICNRLGMDTITCGATIAWAVECFEKGIMKPEDYDGVKLSWGDIDTVIDLLPRIAAREGKLGSLLAKGSRAASLEVGGGSEAFLTDSKGLEAPAHDPRCNWGDGLAYAVSIRGACHVSNTTFLLEWGAVEYPEIGLDKNYQGMSAEFKAEAAAKTADLGCIHNSACWCEFPGTTISIPQWVELFNAVAGYDYDIAALMKAGARIWYLQRCLGHIWGASAEDDRLGPALMRPVNEGMTAGSVPDMDTMLKEFYELRGLGEDGKPLREVLEEHDLGYIADKM